MHARGRTGGAAAEDDADEVVQRARGLDVGRLVVKRVEEGHQRVPGYEAVHADAAQQRLQHLLVLVAERREVLRAVHEHRELGLHAQQVRVGQACTSLCKAGKQGHWLS